MSTRGFQHGVALGPEGLLDLYAGLTAVSIASLWLAGLHAFTGVAPALLLLTWAPLKKMLGPASGTSPEGDTLPGWSIRVLIAAGLAALGVVFVLREGIPFEGTPILDGFAAAIPTLVVGLLLAATALLTGRVRFLAYSGVFVVLGLTTSGVQSGPVMAMGVGGLMMCAIGVARLFRHRG